MLNNLGAMPGIEMSVVLKSVMIELEEVRGVCVDRVYCGPFMTALDMRGVSLSLLRLAPGTVDLLDYPTEATAWIKSPDLRAAVGVRRTIDAPESRPRGAVRVQSRVGCPRAIAIAAAVASTMIEIEPSLSQYDRVCGDGDCGLVMKKGAERLLSDLAALSEESRDQCSRDGALFCDMVANAIGASMGGSLGVLLEIFFRRVSSHLSACAVEDGAWRGALLDGLGAIKQYGGATVGMRTMLDALEPAVLAEGGPAIAAEAARAGMERTKTMDPLAGRSNYVQAEAMRGTPDPGAFAVYMAFTVAAEVL